MSRRRRRSTTGLTLVEIVVSLAVLVVATLGLAYAVSTSVVVTRTSKSRLIAQQAAQRAVDELRSTCRPVGAAFGGPLTTFYTTWWKGAALTNPNTAGAYLGLDATGTYGEILDPALQVGIMARPASGAMLRLRVLSEAAYNAIWGGAADLDVDGDTTSGIERDGSGSTEGANYHQYPIVVEVHWVDELGPQTHRLAAVVTDHPDLDVSRP